MRASAFLAAVAASTPAWAQQQGMPDYCSTSLDPRQSPQATADWRMRCTIQRLVAERAEEADKATQFEVNLAEAEAKAKATRERAAPTAEYWRRYAAGAAAQIDWWRRYAEGLIAKWRRVTIVRRR